MAHLVGDTPFADTREQLGYCFVRSSDGVRSWACGPRHQIEQFQAADVYERSCPLCRFRPQYAFGKGNVIEQNTTQLPIVDQTGNNTLSGNIADPGVCSNTTP